MKTLLIVVMLYTVQCLFAEDLKAKDGTVFQNVVIISADTDRMLIVHDGGGCQVEYVNLIPNSLSPEQRNTVAQKLTEYTERIARREQLRLEQKEFEQAQREKGLILFERDWITPVEREDLLARRELRKLERERLRLELETQKAELRKQQALAEQNERLLSPPRRQTYSYYYSYPTRYRSSSRSYKNSGKCRSAGGLNVSFSSGASSMSYSSGSYSQCQGSTHGHRTVRTNR